MSNAHTIFDSHLHIIAPGFPLYENQGFIPDAFTVEDYLSATKAMNLVGGAIVSGSFQKTDQSYLKAALRALGSRFVGVTQVSLTISDEEIFDLHHHGVRAIRFNLKRGSSVNLKDITLMANRVYELANWHSEFYVDGSDLPELKPILKSLPKFSIDHLGLKKTGQASLITLAESGARIKATGFGRVDFDPIECMRDIYKANPRALMFGTDLPSTRAKTPFSFRDIQRIEDAFDSSECANIFVDNARCFYNTNAPL